MDNPAGATPPTSPGTAASPAAGGGETKLDLTTPAKVAAGKEFTVTLNLETGAPLGNVFAELIFNPEFVEFVSATPGDAIKSLAGLEFAPQSQTGRLSIKVSAPGGIAAKGVAATLVFRAKSKGAMPLWLGVGQIRAQDQSGQVVPINAPAPHKLDVE